MRALFLAPTFSEGTWFAVKDPAVIRSRVGYNTSPQEMSIFAIARRTKVVPLFQTPPQQSDYHAEWTNIGEAKARDSSRLAFFDAAMASKQPPGPLKSAIRGAAPKLWQLWQAIKLARRMQRAPDPSQFEPFPMP